MAFDDPKVTTISKPTNLRDAISRTVKSFNAALLDGKFEMTIDEGYNTQRALGKVLRALAELDDVLTRGY